jgi:hypothetical protein
MDRTNPPAARKTTAKNQIMRSPATASEAMRLSRHFGTASQSSPTAPVLASSGMEPSSNLEFAQAGGYHMSVAISARGGAGRGSGIGAAK